MYRNILVPVAFDKEHEPKEALAAARILAAADAKVTVLHVMEESPPYALSFIPEDYMHDLKRAIAAEMERLASGFENGRAVLVEGHSGRTILHWAEENEVDCIVIASRRPGIQDRVLGSTASWVVGRAHCSVHVVR